MAWVNNLGLWGLFLGNFLAASLVPFSSDALYIGAMLVAENKLVCFLTATVGNWLGSVFTYWMGYLARWEWLEKWFKVKSETLEKQKKQIDRYGVWLALIAWVPIIGDVIALALGFYKVRPLWTAVLLFIGKAGRFLVWTLIMGLF